MLPLHIIPPFGNLNFTNLKSRQASAFKSLFSSNGYVWIIVFVIGYSLSFYAYSELIIIKNSFYQNTMMTLVSPLTTFIFSMKFLVGENLFQPISWYTWISFVLILIGIAIYNFSKELFFETRPSQSYQELYTSINNETDIPVETPDTISSIQQVRSPITLDSYQESPGLHATYKTPESSYIGDCALAASLV
jgi:drug/metabolite transporter (DMT)-like permease